MKLRDLEIHLLDDDIKYVSLNFSDMGANTEFGYLYRDADNYKVGGSVVFVGRITPDEVRAIAKALDYSLHAAPDFIPGQVGLDDLQGVFAAGPIWNLEIDGPYHELTEIKYTNRSPNDREGRDVSEFAQIFATTKWNAGYRPAFAQEDL